jgi:Leucine-rich repeat (LRR) protein
MKTMILEWKNIFPIEEFKMNENMSEKMLWNMIVHYSSKIKKLNLLPALQAITIEGYKYMPLINPFLVELEIKHCFEIELEVICNTLNNLKSLSISDSYDLTDTELDLISKLTNLENLYLDNVERLEDCAIMSYLALTNLKSLKIMNCREFSSFGLDHLLHGKPSLVELELWGCDSVSARGYSLLAYYSQLTRLTVCRSKLDDRRLQLICGRSIESWKMNMNMKMSRKHHLNKRCPSLEYLNVLENEGLTAQGLDRLRCLARLTTFFVTCPDEAWLAKLARSPPSLTHLMVYNCSVDYEALRHLSALVNLTELHLFL